MYIRVVSAVLVLFCFSANGYSGGTEDVIEALCQDPIISNERIEPCFNVMAELKTPRDAFYYCASIMKNDVVSCLEAVYEGGTSPELIDTCGSSVDSDTYEKQCIVWSGKLNLTSDDILVCQFALNSDEEKLECIMNPVFREQLAVNF